MSVYNAESYLRESVKSILDQTFGNYEFIIINDGSTDSSLEILHSFCDPRIRLVCQDNCGLPIALNKAISLAKGAFIARMDADDISLPDRLSIQYKYLLSHPMIDGVGGQAIMIDANGRIIGNINKPVNPDFINKYMEFACPLLHPTFMFKTKVYHTLNSYRSILFPVEDYDFLLRAVEKGFKLANVSEAIIMYRSNPGGLSSQNARRSLVLTRCILGLHRQRMNGKSENMESLLEINRGSIQPCFWFNLWHDLRNSLWIRSKRTSGIYRQFLLLNVVLCSLMHYELFFSSFRGILSLRWLDH